VAFSRWLAAACLGLAAGSGSPAQQGEFGAAAGYGAYRNASVYAPAGKAAAGFRNRFVFSLVLGEDLYQRLAGEARYTYQDGDPFLEAAALQTNIQGQSHAFHYDLLFHVRERAAKLRPFVAVGGGVKIYRPSGPENPDHPLGEIARLTTSTDAAPLMTAGGGVKYSLRRDLLLRVDFRDYITPFPKNLIAPAPFGTARGIFHQLTAMVGISYRF